MKMKKILALGAAVFLLAGSAPAVSAEEPAQSGETETAEVTVENESAAIEESSEKIALPTPVNVAWNDNWKCMFELAEGVTNFSIEIWKNDEMILYSSWSYGDSERFLVIDETSNINESGTYKFRVCAKPCEDDEEYTSSEWSDFSAERVYIRPDEELEQTTAFWDSENIGICKFAPVTGTNRYLVELFLESQEYGNMYTICETWGEFTADSDGNIICDLKDVISRHGSGKYYVAVTALSECLDLLANGKEGPLSEVLDTGVVAETVLNKVEEALNNEDAAAAVESLTDETDISELQIAMQTDNEVLSSVAALEEKYVEQKNVTVESSVSTDAQEYVNADAVSMVGAAFNASENGSLSLEISVPEEKVEISASSYKNPVQLSIKLVNDDTDAEVKELKMPITITMPVPTGITNLAKLQILHYSESGSYELISPKINNDDTLTFTITHFSTFVFAETADEEEDNGETSINDGNVVVSGSAASVVTCIPASSLDKYRKAVLTAKEGATVVIEKNSGITTLTKEFLELLASRETVSLQMEYTYQGEEYSILIPAGKVYINEQIKYYGPLYLYSIYGSMPSTAETTESIYTVLPGDNLSKIAARNGISLGQLISLNPQIKNVNLIRVGQKINLK